MNIDAVVVKGVMDFAGPKRSGRFRAFAAQAAAEVLLELLRRVLGPSKSSFDYTPHLQNIVDSGKPMFRLDKLFVPISAQPSRYWPSQSAPVRPEPTHKDHRPTLRPTGE